MKKLPTLNPFLFEKLDLLPIHSRYLFKFRKLNLLVNKVSVDKVTREIVSQTILTYRILMKSLTFLPCSLVN